MAAPTNAVRPPEPPPASAVRPPEPPPLLASKLAVAPLPEATLVSRDRLFDRLDAAVTSPVTLLSAPAGWGKSVLLASWCGAGRPILGGLATTAWLTVEADDHAAGLRAYLFAALGLGVPAPDTGPELLDRSAAALAARSAPIVLVLDDLHRAEPGVLVDDLHFLSRHAGDRLRLVISTRNEHTLALHRWRLAGELTEIPAAELAFTAEETAELLAAHETLLPVEQVRTLHARTEGWPAGLRLAALALRGHPDPAGCAAGFGGESDPVADYLRHEVLTGVADDVHDALTRGAVAEPLCGALLDTLTGRGDGEELLAGFARATGFLTPLDTPPGEYRCHRMLRDLLRAGLRRLPVEERLELHRRAAGWYAAHGLPASALRHTLAAADHDHARRLLRDHWADLVAICPPPGAAPICPPPDVAPICPPPGSGPAPVPPPEGFGGDPELALAFAAERLVSHDPTAATDHLRMAAAGPRLEALDAAHAGLRLARDQLVGDAAAVRSGIERLLALAVAEPRAGAIARAVRGADRLDEGDLVAAERELADGLALARQAGLRRASLVCAGRLALTYAVQGRLRAAEEAIRAWETVTSSDTGDEPPDSGHAYLARAVVALDRDVPDDAYAGLATTAHLAERADDPVVGVLAAVVRTRLRRDQGDLLGAGEALARGRRYLADRSPQWPPAQWLLAAEADLRTASGDPGAARELLERAGGAAGRPARTPASTEAPRSPQTPRSAETPHPGVARSWPGVAVALARAVLAGGDPRAAERLVPPWSGPVGEGVPLNLRIEAGLLEALAVRALGDERGAARRLEEVLGLAEPEGFRRVFTRAEPPVRDLLAAHLDSGTAYWPMVTALIAGSDQPVEVPPALASWSGDPLGLREPLTERELTVLRYLQSILSNVEIAAELSLSVNTVKTHVRNIYRKLETSRRREAVRRARELHLI